MRTFIVIQNAVNTEVWEVELAGQGIKQTFVGYGLFIQESDAEANGLAQPCKGLRLGFGEASLVHPVPIPRFIEDLTFCSL